LRQPVRGVGLPEEIRRHLRQAAEALLAFAQRLLGLLALQELSDLAAHHAYRLQQALVRLAHQRTGEAQHADRPALGEHWKGEHSADTGSAGQ